MNEAPLPADPRHNFVVQDMPAALYHESEAMSAGGVKFMLRSPQHFRFMRTTPSVPTPVQEFGTAVHAGVLEPDRFGELVACAPKDAPNRPTTRQLYAKKPSAETIEAIAFWQKFNTENAGRLILSADDFARCLACVAAVRAHPAARFLLDGGDRELSLFWRDSQYDVPAKCRFDAYNRGGGIDLKTAADASRDAFARSAANFYYHVSAAHYISGAEHVLNETPRFYVFVVVESEPPHGVACYALESNAILAGARLCNIALARYRDAIAADEWQGYPETVETLALPKWVTQFDAR